MIAAEALGIGHIALQEARLPRIAPISQEMVLNFLAEHVLGLPRSY